MKKHIFFFKLLLLLCLFGISSVLTAANYYYASPTGSGTGAGTLTDPCSFTAGLSKITTAGDTLFLRGGQYDLNTKISINKAGTDIARICIWAYPGETPILDFRGEVYGQPGISLNLSSSYMYFKGLTVRYAGDNGIVNNGNNHIIENCEFYGNCDSGLQHKDGGGNLIKNCDSHDNFDYQSVEGTTPNYGGNADGFADKQFSNANPNTYEGCRSWRNSDDGWDLYQRVGEIIIKNSICYKNGPAVYDLSIHPRATIDAAWFANFTSAQLAAYTNYGNGNGFKIGGDYRPTNSILTNCLSAENKAKGFDQNNSSGSMTIHNCTSYNNSSKNYGFYDRASDNTSVQDSFIQIPVTHAILDIKNCVSLTGTNTFTSATYLTTSNNTWNTTGVTCDASDFISIDASVITSPRQADGSLPNIVFMQLTTGSDLIDAGVNVSLPYSGAAPDLGCFELGNLDQFPGAVNTPINKAQTILQGSPIVSIIFTWSAGATGLTVSGLPEGISTSIDNTAKTLTLSGTPTEAGVFNYIVTTTGGSSTPAIITGRLAIISATGKKIAYFSLPNDASDNAILTKLQTNTDFSVTVINAATASVDYSSYELIIIAPAPATGTYAANFQAIESQNKPMLMLKPFALKNTIWNWGVAANPTPAVSTITVSNKTHEIFTGLTFTGNNSDELVLFSALGSNGVTGITSWYGTPVAAPSLLATIKGVATNQSIIEIPIGTVMGPSTSTTTTTQRFLMIGVSEASTANLTTTATQLIENSCYYLLGMAVPVPVTAIKDTKTDSDFKIIQTETSIEVVSNEAINGLELYATTGNKIASSKNKTISTANLAQGVYLVRIIGQIGNKYTKFIKE